jgi:hypothetical protein
MINTQFQIMKFTIVLGHIYQEQLAIAISWQVKNVGIHMLASLQMTHVEIMIINAE